MHALRGSHACTWEAWSMWVHVLESRAQAWREDGGVSGVSSSCGARWGFLPRHDEDLREPLVLEVFLGGRRETLVSLAFCRGP